MEGSDEYAEEIHSLLALAGVDVESAIAEAKRKFQGGQLRRVLVYLAQEVVSSDLSKLGPFLAHLPDRYDQQSVMSLVARRAVAVDARAFSQFAQEQESPYLKGELLKFGVSALASSQKISEAIDAFDKMPYSTSRSEALIALATGLGRQDPTSAIKWAFDLQLPEDSNAAMRNLIVLFREAGDRTSIKAIGDLSRDPGIQAMAARQQGALSYSSSDGPNAHESDLVRASAISALPNDRLTEGEAIIRTIKEPLVRREATRNYVERLIRISPMQALSWVQSAPTDVKPYAYRALADKWYSLDSMALSNWVKTLPSGAERDIVLTSIADKLRQTDKEAAIEVASQVGNARKRESLLRQLKRP